MDPVEQSTLVAELSAARREIIRHGAALGDDWNLAARLRRSVSNNRLAWISGATVLGLLLSRLVPSRRKIVVVPPSPGLNQKKTTWTGAILLGVLKLGFTFVKPALTAWAQQRFSSPTNDEPSRHRPSP